MEQERSPILYGHLQLLEEVGVIEGSDLEDREADVKVRPLHVPCHIYGRMPWKWRANVSEA